MRFLNKNTGAFEEVSPLQLRLGRLRKRLSYYCDWIAILTEFNYDVDNIFITLTYKGVDDWREKHITEFIRKVKRKLGSRMYGYYWVAEMQKRGAVHYHVVVTVQKGVRLPKLDDAGIWSHGLTRIEKVRFSVYAYLSKYLSKEKSKDGGAVVYPSGIRIFGCSVYVCKKEAAINKLPAWLVEKIQVRSRLAFAENDKDALVKLSDYSCCKKVKGGYKIADYFFDNPYAIKYMREG